METNQLLIAFGLTVFAGLSTGIGSLLAFYTKRDNPKFLSFSLGLSAGVMIYVSFVELFPHSIELLEIEYSSIAELVSSISFFAGILLIAIIDKIIPSYENPHEIRSVKEVDNLDKPKNSKLYKTGILTAFAIAIHNFPEGIAVFAAGMTDMEIALPVAVAIAIHNIPEGIAVSVPIYYATGNRKKAFWLSVLSGLAEPLGAVLAFLLLMPFLNDMLMAIIFGIIAGIMVFISLDELLPTAREYGEHHLSIYGLILGMLLMASTLIIL